MIDTKEFEISVLSLGMPSKLETICQYNSYEYIPNKGLLTIGAYRRKYGRDAKSLSTRIVELQGCELQDSFRPKAIFNDKTRTVCIRFDKSKIKPLSDNGFIVFDVSGRYGFKKLIKLPWAINKTPLKLKNEWININKEDTPITWITGDVTVAKISFILPEEIKDNELWYKIVCPSIEFLGPGSDLYKLQTDKDLLYDVEYDVLYNCCGTLNESKDQKIQIKFKDNCLEEMPHELSVSFIPAIRHVTASLTNSTEMYTLGSSEAVLAQLSLDNKCNDINATANVKVDIECIIDTKREDGLILCDEQHVAVKVNETKKVMIRINPERFKRLPDKDIVVTISVEGNDLYTKATFEESFKLKI